MNATSKCIVLCIGVVVMACASKADTNLEITAASGGYITWTNVDSNLYYTVEWRPDLLGPIDWNGSFRGCQDLRSSEPNLSVPVPVFFRIAGSTMPAHTRILSATSTSVEAGYYEAANLAAIDPDLVAVNIKSGITLFGVTGTLSGGATFPAPVPRSGQTPTLPVNPAPAGSDGALQKGVVWPNPRFSDNTNGTITDNLTGLIWLKNCEAFGDRAWTQALNDCATLNSGEKGLSDGSVEGDWRLPNMKELESLVDWAYMDPALPNTVGTGQWTSGNPFTGYPVNVWSSCTQQEYAEMAWSVDFFAGGHGADSKSQAHQVWPVRGGQ
ncbi:MAG TPA: DUF1566 domain-containing protein [Candidatus Paceibacterota bacterium]|nr:DUF1566 domain-containing protein [Candidatus Paceibacterota bacterium]